MALFFTSRGAMRKGRSPGLTRTLIKVVVLTVPVAVTLYLVLAALHFGARSRAEKKPSAPSRRYVPLEIMTAARANLGGKPYVEERPWKDPAPAFCRELIAHPRGRRRGQYYGCGRGRHGTRCPDGRPSFFGQENQDIWVWQNHFRHLKRRGVYLDIAANEAMELSSTFFFDRCLNWRGLCVEPHPRYLDDLVKRRSCGLVQTCVSNREEKVRFVLYQGLSGVAETNKNTNILRSSPSMALTCVPTSRAIAASGMQHFDLLSLDVEGHEHKVLEGIDWARVRINVIIIESLKPETEAMLLRIGYRKVKVPETEEELSKPGALFQDAVFAWKDVKWGAPV